MTEIPYAQALAKLRQLACSRTKPATEERAPAQALDRLAAAAVTSPVSIPRHANSAVDGFALRSRDLAGISLPARVPVLGSIVAGDAPPASVHKSIREPRLQAWEIMTGAPFPEGFDCSVKVEDVELIRTPEGRTREIVLAKAPEARENLREAGEDFSRGERVLRPGERIGPERILALETLGIPRIEVFRRPRVAVISTGGELCAQDLQPREGQIRNSTAPFLLAALEKMGAEAELLGTAGDNPAEYLSILAKALERRPDIIISTGAVSMGVHDYVPSVVADLGGSTLFHRVSIRPGKPVLAAEFPGSVFFGLPGNPVSTVVGLRFIIDPYLRAWTGQPDESPAWARLSAAVHKPEGLRCFFKARVSLGREGAQVGILRGQASFRISPLLRATAWAVLPEGGRELQAGEWIEVYPLYASSYPWAYPWAAAAELGNQPHSEKGGCCT